MRRLDAEELIAIDRLAPLLSELRGDVLERLANSTSAEDDIFLKGKAQAYADLARLPALQEAMDDADRKARVGGEEYDNGGHRPEIPVGIWQRLKDRYGAGRT